MRLFIAEKPDLGKAIADALTEPGRSNQSRGDGYIKVGGDTITWCFGHLLQLKDPSDYDEKYAKWNINDLPFNVDKMELKPIKDKNKQIKIIKELLREATEIVNAGDPDEEGQLLVDEVLEYLGNKKPVKRILINDNTKSAVQKSLNNLRNNKDFQGLRNSAYVRSVGDWKYGLNLTRAYTIKSQNNGNKGVLSVGRVQTPILNLIHEREQEVKHHKKELYYNLLTDNNFKYVIPKEKLEDKLCKDKTYLEDIKTQCQTANDFKITSVDIKKQENHPPLPYNLLELQADAFRKFKYKPDKVKDITQSLREKHKAITYNRSDCQYLTDEHYEQREDVIVSIKNNLSEFSSATLDTKVKHKTFNNANVSAHHAIIPTINSVNMNNLSIEEQNIYRIIAERYLVLFMPPKVLEKTTYTARNSSNLEFNTSTSKVLSLGYESFYSITEEKVGGLGDNNTEDGSNDTSESNNVYSYAKGDKASFKGFNIIEGETKPKQLYTFATLLKDLTSVAKYIKDPAIKKLLIEKDSDKKSESGGIGTPATRDTIIKILFDRGFVIEEKAKIKTTELGKSFLKALPEIAKTPDMTALWADKQSEIRQNKLGVDEFLLSIDDFVKDEIARIKLSTIKMEGVSNESKAKENDKKGFVTKSQGAKGNIKSSASAKNGVKNEVEKIHSCPNCKTGTPYKETRSIWGFLGL